MRVDAPYANSLMKRCKHRSFVSREEWRSDKIPSSVATRDKSENIFDDIAATLSPSFQS